MTAERQPEERRGVAAYVQLLNQAPGDTGGPGQAGRTFWLLVAYG